MSSEQPTPASKGPLDEISDILIKEMNKMFSPPPGYRPAHAKGLMLSGVFTPAATASSLSSSPIFRAQLTSKITARLSSATGIYRLPDFAPAGHPRGLALRIHHEGSDYTDILVQSSPHFPIKTGGEEFYLFLLAAQDPHGIIMAELAKTRPYLRAFLAAKKTMPSSFARDNFFGVNAFKLTPKDCYVRYRLIPNLGTDFLTTEALEKLAAEGKVDFLYEDIKTRLAGDGYVTFTLAAQVAKAGDDPNDSSVHWSEENDLVSLGQVRLDTVFPEAEQVELNKTAIFDPMHTGPGIEPSDDPLLAVRHTLYNMSGERRRAAGAPSATESVQRCPFTSSVVPQELDMLSKCH